MHHLPHNALAYAMTIRSAKLAIGLQVALLLLGTLMPGHWRSGLEASLHAPFGLSSWAHALLFAGMSMAALAMRWRTRHVALAALALALATEALQFFAIDRHPRWIDVGIDMAGAAFGLLVVGCWGLFCSVCGSRLFNGDKG